jgi:hypothetical protein
MALANKKNKTIFTKTGDGKDKVDDTKITELETKFANGEHIQDRGSFAQLGIVYLQLQNISEEIDELRRYMTNDISSGTQGPKGDKGDQGATGANGKKGDTPTMDTLSGSTLPTSNRGLNRGDLWNDRGIVKVN